MQDKRSFITASNITCPHGFSTRWGGVSKGVFADLNLGRMVADDGDRPAAVGENWVRFGKAVGIDTSRFVYGRQVHGNLVRIVGWEDARNILDPASWVEGDGFVTDVPGLPLSIFTADCVPLLLQEPEAGIVGAVHCGWRGTVADIEGEAIAKIRQLGGDVRQLRAAIGPSIRRCCFQTGPEVPEAIEELLGGTGGDLYGADPTAEGKFRVDLAGVVKRRLLQLGVLEVHIEDTGVCTMCRPDMFWSYRSMGMARGSQANIIMLQ